jgi:short-subunit dehydrogenase
MIPGMTQRFSSILITGASSGLGAALARRYASSGCFLALQGRDRNRLAKIASICIGLGATVETALVDVTDHAALKAWILDIDARHALDLVIANAGVAGGSGDAEAQMHEIMAVNVTGVIATIMPAIDCMRPRGRGTIAIMSSLAGFRGLPGAAAYCASKAAIRVLGESLRSDFAHDNIGVSVICPGFVTTPMTARNKSTMPMLMDADRAAAIIDRGLARNRARIAFPLPIFLLALSLSVLPPSWVDRVLRRQSR